MTEQNEQTKPTKPLTLSTTTRTGAAAKGGSDATQVRQKFSHGRTSAVTVEVKKPVKRPPGASAPAGAAPAHDLVQRFGLVSCHIDDLYPPC